MYNQQTLNSTIPTLRPYQLEDVAFLKKYKCAACFNEQRTGKTPTAIRSLIEKGLNKILIVCPKSGIYPWCDEFTRWTGKIAIAVAGTKAQKAHAVNLWLSGALVISYDSLKTTSRSSGLLTAILAKHPDAVILDEAHRIKDRTTANAEAAFNIARAVDHRLALTGTPAPNKPQEIWSILHFLYPTQFFSYWDFIEEYFTTYLASNAQGRKYKDIGNIRPNKVAKLQYILNQCATQRKRKDVMPWLPQKEYQRIRLPATALQTKYLQELKDYFETEHIVTQGILDRLMRYRQICLHPALLDLPGTSPKLDWLKDYVADYPERPTLVFSKFTSFIHILEKELPKDSFRVIIGDTSAARRAENIKDFQNGKYNLLILQIDAGKENLTLDRAEAIIFTDKYPPVGDISQAEDRFVATTKKYADKPHTIYELVIKNTYDELIYTLLEQRADAIAAINNFKAYMQTN